MSKFAALLAVGVVSIVTAACTTIVNPKSTDTCLSPGPIQNRVTAFKAADFTPTDTQSYSEMATVLASCLGAPDPAIRDGIAYEGLTHLLRGQSLSTRDMHVLKRTLLDGLQGDGPDGFLKPFAALVMAEVVRADRVEPYLNEAERQDILDAGIAYFISITDYRGFDQTEGWRHGIAHGADLMMQISLNPAYGKPDHLNILDALAVQITTDRHAYTQGEGERLARPVLFIARAKTLSDEEWQTWFETLVDPAPLVSWGDAFSSEADLKRLHNIKYALFPTLLQAYPVEGTAPLLPGLLEAVMSLP